jgi:hypothetical protein
VKCYTTLGRDLEIEISPERDPNTCSLFASICYADFAKLAGPST